MADLPPETPPDPISETQAHIPEFKREPRNLPIAGVAVIFLLLVVGAGLLTFAFVYGQQDTENRAIDGTVAAVISFTHTPTNTRPPTETPPPTSTPQPTDTATETPQPSETLANTAVPSATVSPTRTKAPVVAQPTDVPPTAPPPPTSAPAVGAHGITGQLQLCDPSKTSYAAKAETSIGLIERVCIIETITNHNSNTTNYAILGVLAQNTSGGPNAFQTSWRGDLAIPGNCTGPDGNGCGGAHTDTGFFIDNPGNYVLSLRICYSGVDACLGNTGEWETLTGGIPITIISWTPSP
jgi:hypothetical protein